MIEQKQNEIEVEKITNYENYYKFHQNLLSVVERKKLSYLSLLCAKRIENGFMERICRCCKKYYILGSETYVLCSECKKIIENEIKEFENYINLKYDIFEKEKTNQIFSRIKLLLWCERSNFMKRKFEPSGLYYFAESPTHNNLSYFETIKIIRTIQHIQSLVYQTKLDSLNDFDFIGYGLGSTDKKFIKALKYCIKICPEIFSKYSISKLKKLLN